LRAGPAEGVAENGRFYPGGRSEGEISPPSGAG